MCFPLCLCAEPPARRSSTIHSPTLTLLARLRPAAPRSLRGPAVAVAVRGAQRSFHFSPRRASVRHVRSLATLRDHWMSATPPSAPQGPSPQVKTDGEANSKARPSFSKTSCSSSAASLSPVFRKSQLSSPSQDEFASSSPDTASSTSPTLRPTDRADPDLVAALSEAISDDMTSDQEADDASGIMRPPPALLSFEESPSSRSSTPTPSSPALNHSRDATGESVQSDGSMITSVGQGPRQVNLQPSPAAIETPPSPSFAPSRFTPSSKTSPDSGTSTLPSATDGVFIRKPGQAWQPQPHLDQQQYRLVKNELPHASARQFSSYSRAGGSATAALSDLLSDKPQSPSRRTSEASVEKSSGRTSAEEPQSEDNPVSAAFSSIWDRLASLAPQPDQDGVVRPPWSSQPSSQQQEPQAQTSNGSIGADASASFFNAIGSLRKSLGFQESEDAAWMKEHRAELEGVVKTSSGKGQKEAEEGGDMEVGGGEHGGKTIETSPLRVQDRWEHPRLPVCFSHGLFGFDTINVMPSITISYWRGVVEALEANGCEVLVCRVPTSASIQERAAAMKAQIEERFAGRDINLIAHSMGGLDSRHLISNLRPSFTVRSLTTITTPHRGSTFADFMLWQVIGQERLPSLLSMLKTIGLPGGGRAFENLTTESMREFNKRTPDNPNTKYFSWGAEFTPSVFNEFRIPHGIIYEKEGANDGLVSVESARWGQFQGSLQNVNHLQIVGWRTGGSLMKLAFGQNSVFNATNFYLQICEDLAKEGF